MFVVLFVACGNSGVGADGLSDKAPTDTALDDSNDEVPPLITFEVDEQNRPSGQDVELEANIMDEGSGVFTATLYFRNETDGSKDWKSIGFVSLGSDLWMATISADEQHSSGMWYYIRAVDFAQNEAFFPEDGEVDPLHFGYAD